VHDDFKPAWWLLGPHLQTLWPVFFRRKLTLNITTERLELVDGDFLDLAWVGNSGPIVLLLHGLNGSIESPYINGMLAAIEHQGWRGVVMHFRGCSTESNRLARSYHSGETADLLTVLNELVVREPQTPICIVGYSLGGNVLLKALGTCKIPSAVKAAVAVSIPFELAKTAQHMSTGLAYLYQRHLVRGLVTSYKRKFKNIAGPQNLLAVTKLQTFWQFDDAVTAPLHKFKDAAEYYQLSSSRQYLKNISLPTLIIHARNDPFTNADSLPQPSEVSAKVSLNLTNDGGHVGFITGNYPWRPIYWLEQQIINYFIAQLVLP
jgi:predicted alpha/beta-fold hydrolase